MKTLLTSLLLVVTLLNGAIFAVEDSPAPKNQKQFKRGAEQKESPWKPLFNGKDIFGWMEVSSSFIDDWKIANGVLECHGSGGGWIYAPGEFANFQLKLEFRVSPGGNSGVFLRAPHGMTPHVEGLEVQILDDTAAKFADFDNMRRCGSLMLEVGPSKRASKKADEWQQMEIVCNGPRVRVTLNGEQVVDVDLETTQPQEKHPGRKRKSGFIGLQDHGDRVDFRNLQIRELP